MLLLIHGAGSSSYSWNYISIWLEQPIQTLEYTVGQEHSTIFDRVENPEDIDFVIGHSYGALLGAEWLDKNPYNVKGLMTIACPWQGSPTARVLKWFLSDPVWTDMTPGSNFLKKINTIQSDMPLRNIVAVPDIGNGLAGTGDSQNDGTIPISSARSVPEGFTNVESVDIPRTHSEVLQSMDTVEEIKRFISEIK
jgi:hypothetical protein|tara:strand:- start:7324 stop:7908 length:585 start_codon:yes stop_codon:yes gene_type:complete